ncbi:MAG TPA: HlyD family efflux transporter periplasmic adaptor subunit [Chroococcidiopsis sp.]
MAQSLSESPQSDEVEALTPKRSPQRRWLLPVGVVVVAGGLAAWYWLSHMPSDNLQLTGRIEGYETDIGTKVPGRVEEITVREGETVKVGDLLARLDDAELKAQLQGAIATLEAARQQVTNARLQISVLENQLAEAQLNLQQSSQDSQGRVYQAEASVAGATAQLREAEAQVIQAQSELRLAAMDRDRYIQLAQDGVVPQQRADQAQTAYETAAATVSSRQASVEAARRQVNATQGSLTQSRSSNLNPDIRLVQINRLTTQLEQAQVQLASAQAQVDNAEASRQRIQAQLNDLTIRSPIDGVVTVRSVEPGTVVTTGKTLLSLVNLNTVYLRGFIPEGDIGRVRVGQDAQIFLDSDPRHPLAGRVIAIDAEASFTPENIYFQEDRVQQVFGIRIAIESPGGYAKPGMPADAELFLDDNS